METTDYLWFPGSCGTNTLSDWVRGIESLYQCEITQQRDLIDLSLPNIVYNNWLWDFRCWLVEGSNTSPLSSPVVIKTK